MPKPREVAILLVLATTSVTYAQNLRRAESVPKADTVSANIMLCDSPEHAIAFTVAINDGAPDDIAKDIVGRAAGAEVCDKFIGHASVDEQKTLWDKGHAYTVTAYKFKGVGAMKWAAIPKDRE